MQVSTESRYAVATLNRLTGKRYPKLEAAFEALSVEGLQELVRLVHDIDDAVHQAERKAAREPWRRT